MPTNSSDSAPNESEQADNNKRILRSLEYEQKMRSLKIGVDDNEMPNVGNDRLLHKLREVHGNARYDVPPQLMRETRAEVTS
jgi:hypothetical protein